MALATGVGIADGRFRLLSAADHVGASIADILATPKGARVMRPEYGSDLPRLVDAPMNEEWKLRVYMATADALRRWEPRVEVIQTVIDEAGAGTVTLTVKYRLAGGEEKEATVAL